MTMRRLVPLAFVLCTACASHETTEAPKPKPAADDGATPKPEPKPEPDPEPVAQAAIASVQMIQDCPDPKPVAQKPAAPAQPAAPAPSAAMPIRMEDAARGASARGTADFVQPCTQSTVQIAFTGQGDTTGAVHIEEVRLLLPDGSRSVATLTARSPTAWAESGRYEPWDQIIGPRKDVKASYKITVPEWSKVDAALDSHNSMGHMFLLEIDIAIGGQRQTIRSPQFPREEPHIIVT